MKSQVLNTVWCNISGEATGEISVNSNTNPASTQT